jgi:predicted phage-related endonuclease
VASVLGINPFRTPLAVYADKTDQGKTFAGNEATQIGDDFEDALLFRAARIMNLQGLTRNQWRVDPAGGVLAATCDAVASSRQDKQWDRVVEAKTSGILNPGADLEDWGDDGTSQVPDRINVQVQAQLACTNYPVGIVTALLGRKGPRLYIIQRDDAAIGYIRDYCNDWWKRHVQGGIPPQATSPEDNDVVKYFRRTVGKSVRIPDDVFQNRSKAKELAKEAEKVADTAEAALKVALGDAEIGEFTGGVVKYAEENAGLRVNTELLKKDYPNAYKAVAIPSTRRILRVKKS